LRNLALLEGALCQPRQTFSGANLYPTLIDKAASLGFSLIVNHPFRDGNKRIGHAAMTIMLLLNGYKIEASTESAEAVILAVASGTLDRQGFTDWVRRHVKPLG
jgi:death-on-curing protein